MCRHDSLSQKYRSKKNQVPALLELPFHCENRMGTQGNPDHRSHWPWWLHAQHFPWFNYVIVFSGQLSEMDMTIISVAWIRQWRLRKANLEAETEDLRLNFAGYFDQWSWEGERSKEQGEEEVREMGEKSEAAGGMINVKYPGKLSKIRNKKRPQGFGWKDTTDDFSVVSLPK